MGPGYFATHRFDFRRSSARLIRAFFEHDLTSCINGDVEQTSLEWLEQGDRFRVVAGGKKHPGISGTNRHMWCNISHIWRNNGSNAFRDLLISYNLFCNDYRGIIKTLCLNGPQNVNDLDSTHCPAPADHLPVAEMGGLVQYRMNVAKQDRENK